MVTQARKEVLAAVQLSVCILPEDSARVGHRRREGDSGGSDRGNRNNFSLPSPPMTSTALEVLVVLIPSSNNSNGTM